MTGSAVSGFAPPEARGVLPVQVGVWDQQRRPAAEGEADRAETAVAAVVG
ncbi:hypothetical protein [Streptomyces sp. NPDC046759]